jgi:hypothetical protein
MNIYVKKYAVDHVFSYNKFIRTIKLKKNLIHKKSMIMPMTPKIEVPEEKKLKKSR